MIYKNLFMNYEPRAMNLKFNIIKIFLKFNIIYYYKKTFKKIITSILKK